MDTTRSTVFLTGGTSFVPAVRDIFNRRFDAGRIESGGELLSIEALRLPGNAATNLDAMVDALRDLPQIWGSERVALVCGPQTRTYAQLAEREGFDLATFSRAPARFALEELERRFPGSRPARRGRRRPKR